MSARPLTRVAHAYGNSRDRIEAAVAAGVELIEADLRYRNGQIEIRHDYRVPLLPLLYNSGLRGIHKQWPWSVTLGSRQIRLDVERPRLPELLWRVSGRAGLMLDLKRDKYPPEQQQSFIKEVSRSLDECRFAGDVGFCGYWPFLDAMRAARPDAKLWYSVDTVLDCERIESRFEGADRIRAVTVQRDLLTPERASSLARTGVQFYAWDIETRAQAERAIALGASGIIADDLEMMRGLVMPVAQAEGA